MKNISINGKIVVNNLEIASNFWQRFKGLMLRKSLGEAGGLLILKCGSIHTCFMKFTIDVVYLSKDFRVLGKETVKPWRVGKAPKGAKHTLELAEGDGEVFPVGEKVEVTS